MPIYMDEDYNYTNILERYVKENTKKSTLMREEDEDDMFDDD